MKIYLVIFFFLSAAFVTYGQGAKISFIASKQFPAEVLPISSLYRLPGFQKGKVFFKDGSVSEARLNYHLLLGDVMFISENGDTLAIADEKSISYLKTDSITLIYHDGAFLEFVKSDGFPKLAVQKSIGVANKQKLGAYDIPSTSTKIESYQTYSNGRANDRISINEHTLFSRKNTYFFYDDKGYFVPANQKGIVALLPSYRTRILSFMKEKELDLIVERDLLTLLDFIKSLQENP